MTERILAEGQLPNGASACVIAGDTIDDALASRIVDTLEAAFQDRWPAYEIPVPPIEHLRWKLRGPFAECPSHVVVVESDGLVAYLTISMRGRARVGGRDLELQTGGDACTHPALGGRGMFTEGSGFSRTHTYSLFDAGLGFSTNATVRRNRVRAALRKPPANEPRSLLRVYRPWAAAADRRAGGFARLAWAAALTPLALAGAVRRPRLEPGRDWQVAPVTSFDERFDRFFDEAVSQFAFAQVRSAEYLTWRYLDPRAPRATVAAAVDSAGEVLGYVAYKLQGARGSILDVLALPGRLDVVRSLVAHADEAFKRAGACAAQCWLPNVPRIVRCCVPTASTTAGGSAARRATSRIRDWRPARSRSWTIRARRFTSL